MPRPTRRISTPAFKARLSREALTGTAAQADERRCREAARIAEGQRPLGQQAREAHSNAVSLAARFTALVNLVKLEE